MRTHVLVAVTSALVVIVGVVAWPRADAPPPTPRRAAGEDSGPRVECVMPDPALDDAAVATGKLSANEAAVEALLRHLVTAQARFQARTLADEDGDGVGEYGRLGELAGEVAVRGGARLDPPLLPRLGQGGNGRYEYRGYYLRIDLPPDDVDLGETTWCCYAWPVEPEAGRTYFVSQLGDVLANEETSYGGDLEPAPAAAYRAGSDALTGNAAVNARGNDGATWRVVR